jgi:hypothetical protein
LTPNERVFNHKLFELKKFKLNTNYVVKFINI